MSNWMVIRPHWSFTFQLEQGRSRKTTKFKVGGTDDVSVSSESWSLSQRESNVHDTLGFPCPSVKPVETGVMSRTKYHCKVFTPLSFTERPSE